MHDASSRSPSSPAAPALQYPTVPLQWHIRGLAVLVASGPSLTREDVAYCRERARVLVVNDAWQYAPWADALYACDAKWWNHHQGVPQFQGQRWTAVSMPGGKLPMNEILASEQTAARWDLQWVRGDYRLGLSLDRGLIHFGGNSGFQALNLAVLFGARRILLLGYDMKAKGGRTHFFGEHPDLLRADHDYQSWQDHFRAAVPDLERGKVEVINCSRETALDCFPRAELRSVL